MIAPREEAVRVYAVLRGDWIPCSRERFAAGVQGAATVAAWVPGLPGILVHGYLTPHDWRALQRAKARFTETSAAPGT